MASLELVSFYIIIVYLIHAVIPIPLNLMIMSVSETNIAISWEKPSLLKDVIIYYQVSLDSGYIKEVHT